MDHRKSSNFGGGVVNVVERGLEENGGSKGEWYIVGGVVVVVGILLILLVVFIACKPWRYFRSSTRSNLVPSKVEDLDRPLIPGGVEACTDEVYSSAQACNLEGPGYQADECLHPPQIAGLIPKQRIPVSSPRFNHGVSVVVDAPNPSEGICVGQTLKRPLGTYLSFEKQKLSRKEDSGVTSEVVLDIEHPEDVGVRDTGYQRSCLTLEVLSGPSQGTRHSVQSTDTPGLPLTMGRVSPSDVLVKDSEVSGKHAMINWNLNKHKWELVDMGSLNGTLLNYQPINHPDSGSRHWGDPFELASGDIITVGTTSTISVS